jgi:hypothetical protein
MSCSWECENILHCAQVHTWFRDQRRKIRELQGLRQVPENTHKKLMESAARFVQIADDSAAVAPVVSADVASMEPRDQDGSDSDGAGDGTVTLHPLLPRALTANEAKTVVLEELCDKAQRARMKTPSPASASKAKRGSRAPESLLCDEGDDDGPIKRARDAVVSVPK